MQLGMAPAHCSLSPSPNLILLPVPALGGGDIFCPIPVPRLPAGNPFYIKKCKKL